MSNSKKVASNRDRYLSNPAWIFGIISFIIGVTAILLYQFVT